ncbi:vanin-like protein 1 isoform X2 [Bicyclus anynana]|uniref:Vanin-like protein 1 isoform X2 n=1 Tax=Bicyclus anynana TaxID=110368 RepID=A0ABM3LSY2_BICAN|nr:vanin-like protein 1 isoform X2 [Bicyclus anynana]
MRESYRAAVVDVKEFEPITHNKYTWLIYEAAKANVDLLVLPSPRVISDANKESCANGEGNFDEVVTAVSAAAQSAQMYVVAPLYERVTCQDKVELVSSNLVFDRTGALIAVHRKASNNFTKCNTTSSTVGRFTTDFGVTFGIVVEEDLILASPQDIAGIENFVVTDNTLSKKSFLFAKQFESSFAFVNKVNVISSSGEITGERTPPLIIAKLRKNGSDHSTLLANPPRSFPSEDLSQYVSKPLNVEASLRGYSDSVCHGTFCCQFYVKSSSIGTNPQDISYGLMAFDGIHQSGSTNIGVQACSLVACAGLYKRSCFIGSKNTTADIKFSQVSINANFSKENSAQFPTVLTTAQTIFNSGNLKFSIVNKEQKSVTSEIYNTENILTFGIVGRDYSKDFNDVRNNTKGYILDFSEYISSENVQEFFDYVWIRLRVLIFIVSVYILEMM